MVTSLNGEPHLRAEETDALVRAAPTRGSTGGRGDLAFALAVAAVFAAVAATTAFHHEMWRDELQAWLLARDSTSPLALLGNSRHEGHPVLWFLLLWPVTRLTHDPAAMQVLHVALAAAAVFLVAWKAPAPRAVRALAALGYYPVYEYGSIARNYAVGLLLLVAFCVLFPRRRERPLLLGAVLFLLAESSLPAAILAVAALGALALDLLLEGAGRGRARSVAGLGLGAAGVAASAAQMMPPADTGFATGTNLAASGQAAVQVLATVPEAFLPVPAYGPGFWQSALLDAAPGYAGYGWLLAIPLVTAVALSLVRRPVALAYYLIGTAGLLAFFYVKTLGYLRHHGFLFLCAATALWLACTLPPRALRGGWDRWGRGAERLAPALLVALLGVQLVGGAIAVAGEHAFTFSGAKGAAAILRARGLERLPLVADRDYMSPGVTGYLERDRTFFPAGRRWGTYVVWDRARYQRFDVWEQAVGLALAERSPVVVLLDTQAALDRPVPPRLRPAVKELGCVTGEVVRDEGFCLYLLGAEDRSP